MPLLLYLFTYVLSIIRVVAGSYWMIKTHKYYVKIKNYLAICGKFVFCIRLCVHNDSYHDFCSSPMPTTQPGANKMLNIAIFKLT